MKVNVNNGDLNKAIRALSKFRAMTGLTAQRMREKEYFCSNSKIKRKKIQNRLYKVAIQQKRMDLNHKSSKFKSRADFNLNTEKPITEDPFLSSGLTEE